MGAVSLPLLLLMEDLLTRALRGTSLSAQWASQTEVQLAPDRRRAFRVHYSTGDHRRTRDGEQGARRSVTRA